MIVDELEASTVVLDSLVVLSACLVNGTGAFDPVDQVGEFTLELLARVFGVIEASLLDQVEHAIGEFFEVVVVEGKDGGKRRRCLSSRNLSGRLVST